MDRAGAKASPLSPDEEVTIFELVRRGGSREEARRRMASRDHSTVNRWYNVVQELALRDLDDLDTKTAQEIAYLARYSTTPYFVQNVLSHWKAWKHPAATACDESVHQEFLRGRLEAVMMELRHLRNNFPTVFHISYRPEDPANRLRWTEENGTVGIDWSLAVESEPGWSLVHQHLITGLPMVAEALDHVKGGYAQYCKGILTLEDGYRAAVGGLELRDLLQVELNESHFYRSILSEVDKAGIAPGPEEYKYGALSGWGMSVAFDGMELITRAADREVAEEWVARHLRWREEMREMHVSELRARREELVSAITVVISCVEELEQGGKVHGRCSRFSN